VPLRTLWAFLPPASTHTLTPPAGDEVRGARGSKGRGNNRQGHNRSVTRPAVLHARHACTRITAGRATPQARVLATPRHSSAVCVGPGAGLTVSAVKEGGAWSLEAGACECV
jgi:hypothetical protein